MSKGDEYNFACPECAEVISVNDGMREALLDNGCVICGADVSPEAFSRPGDGASGDGP